MRTLLAGVVALSWSRAAEAEMFGPYLGDVSGCCASIAWRTDEASSSIVEFGEGAGPLSMSVLDPGSVVQHELRIEGLVPGTLYSYRVRSEAGGQVVFESGPHTFRTAPPRGTPFSFVFLAEVHAETATADFDPVVLAFDPSFQVQPGDNVDDAAALDQFQTFFSSGAWYPSVPLFNSFGNHNYQQDDGGLIPDNTDAALSLELLPPHRRYYTFRWGDAQFFALDSSHYLSDEVRDDQPAWFENELMLARDGVDDPALMVAFFHIPVHSSCGALACVTRRIVENPWVERELIARIEQYGVHLVLNGHDKINEHSVVNGVHYIQVTSGASPRDLGCSNPGSQWSDDSGLALMRATVSGCELAFDLVRPDGSVLYTGSVVGDCDLVPQDGDSDGSSSEVDCDDADADRFPGNEERCGDSVDQDCDGSDDVCPLDAGAPDAMSPDQESEDASLEKDMGERAADGGVTIEDAGATDLETLARSECGCTGVHAHGSASDRLLLLIALVLVGRARRRD